MDTLSRRLCGELFSRLENPDSYRDREGGHRYKDCLFDKYSHTGSLDANRFLFPATSSEGEVNEGRLEM